MPSSSSPEPVGSLADRLARRPYQDYVYAYPHKSAYRALTPAQRLADLWREEDRGALFLYLHIPFCEMRCGYCNLFARTAGGSESFEPYLAALRRQGDAVRSALEDWGIGAFGIGGGTPTLLPAASLDQLLTEVREAWGFDPARLPSSVETSPATATPDRLGVLRDHGIERISIGIQSFVEAEVRAAGRVQPPGQARAALDAIDAAGFPIRNLDLIYGLPGQRLETWELTLAQALARAPEELYLYPLYVRPQTGLARQRPSGDDLRPSLYRYARDRLLGAGYRQISMRAFRRVELRSRHSPYRCQADGMVGLGCGARSYTRSLHYSHRYAVGRAGIDRIVADYLRAEDAQHRQADHGILLDEEDQRRRWVLKSLLLAEGLDLPAYRARFGDDPWRHLDTLGRLLAEGLATIDGDRLKLGARGLELSDAIGPWLYSAKVRARMAEPV